MEHFVIIFKAEHTGICMLKPAITVKVTNRRDGNVSIDISGSDDMGDSLFSLLCCGDFHGRYIEDYEKDTQKKMLDSIETIIAMDIAMFATMGYTYVGIDTAKGEEPSECFFLEDHMAKWQKDYRCLLEQFQQESIR